MSVTRIYFSAFGTPPAESTLDRRRAKRPPEGESRARQGIFRLTRVETAPTITAIAHPGDCGLRTIAVCNLKGGVGKTTTAVNLGASLARNGKRVLLIDCDPQCNLTTWLRAEPDNGGATLYEILRGQATVRAAAVPTRWANIHVVPASPKLHEIDRGALAGERVLWARMCDDYDYALLDCSASPGVVLTNALTAAQEVIAPVQAKGMALSGLERLQQMVNDIASRANTDVRLSGVLVCLFDGRTTIARVVLGQLRAKYGELVFDTVVHDNVKLSEAADKRRPIVDLSPTSRGAAEYAAVAFELVAREYRATGGPESVIAAFNFPSSTPRPFLPAAPAPTMTPLTGGVAPTANPHAAVGNGARTQDASGAPASAHHVSPPSAPLGQD